MTFNPRTAVRLVNERLIRASALAPFEVANDHFTHRPHFADEVRRVLDAWCVHSRGGLQVLSATIRVTFHHGVGSVVRLMFNGRLIHRHAVTSVAFRGLTALPISIFNGHSRVANMNRRVRGRGLCFKVLHRRMFGRVDTCGADHSNGRMDFRVCVFGSWFGARGLSRHLTMGRRSCLCPAG